MPEYIPAGIIFQTIILERDEAGNIVTEHVMPPAKSHWPYVDIPETIKRQVEEFSRPLESPKEK
jgi:hypothetical protein